MSDAIYRRTPQVVNVPSGSNVVINTVGSQNEPFIPEKEYDGSQDLPYGVPSPVGSGDTRSTVGYNVYDLMSEDQVSFSNWYKAALALGLVAGSALAVASALGVTVGSVGSALGFTSKAKPFWFQSRPLGMSSLDYNLLKEAASKVGSSAVGSSLGMYGLNTGISSNSSVSGFFKIVAQVALAFSTTSVLTGGINSAIKYLQDRLGANASEDVVKASQVTKDAYYQYKDKVFNSAYMKGLTATQRQEQWGRYLVYSAAMGFEPSPYPYNSLDNQGVSQSFAGDLTDVGLQSRTGTLPVQKDYAVTNKNQYENTYNYKYSGGVDYRYTYGPQKIEYSYKYDPQRVDYFYHNDPALSEYEKYMIERDKLEAASNRVMYAPAQGEYIEDYGGGDWSGYPTEFYEDGGLNGYGSQQYINKVYQGLY